MPFGLDAVAMHVAYRSGVTTLASRLLPGHGCLLAFHRVAASDAWTGLPNREFYIDTGFLRRLLDRLTETGWAIVTMEEAVSRLRDGDRSRFVNFSIDDVYRDTVESALPIFRDHGAPVTLYVTTGIPDGTVRLWQAGLETIVHEQNTVTLESGAVADTGTDANKRELFGRLCAAWENGPGGNPLRAVLHPERLLARRLGRAPRGDLVHAGHDPRRSLRGDWRPYREPPACLAAVQAICAR